jgi:hypothetical protein
MNDYRVTLQGQEYSIRAEMIAALQRYLNEGTPTGGFLRAVLAHDLAEAAARADIWNMPNLPAYAAYMYNEIPSSCHGSYEIVDAWIAHSGLTSIQSDRALDEED